MNINDALAANLRSMQARKRLQQSDVAERMSALGYSWRRQTVSQVMRGERRVLAEEVYALALTLETTVSSLIEMPDDAHFPNGAALSGIPD